MRNKYFIIILVLLSALFLSNCSEVEDDISQPPILEGVHGKDNINPTSDEFHGKLMEGSGFVECQKCHAANFAGGTTEVSCIECHPSVSVHQDGIFSASSPNFHGKFLADNELEMSECKTCHGIEYEGGVSSPTCANCHSGINVHKVGIVSPSSPDFHGKYIINQNWALAECSTCHGEDYSGGLVSNSCNTCHTGTNGPESCNTCHGDFSDESKIAPPRDLNGNIQTSAKGVGAHSSHLSDNMLSAEISCYECHPKIENTDNFVFAHIDGLPAEMEFGSVASAGASSPSYNSDLSCSNTYCHGNFAFSKDDAESKNLYAYTDTEIVGNNFSPIWNVVDDTQAECGTCHGRKNELGDIISPTPIGHFGNFQADACFLCHRSVFDENGELIKSKHINGEKDLD